MNREKEHLCEGGQMKDEKRKIERIVERTTEDATERREIEMEKYLEVNYRKFELLII